MYVAIALFICTYVYVHGARPYTANGTIEDLVAGGTGDGFVPILVS